MTDKTKGTTDKVEAKDKAVQDKLNDTLNSLGLTKTNHNSMVSAYNRLFGEKRVDKDRADWLVIGKFAAHAKDKILDKKSGLNNGILDDYRKLYFPAITAAEFSNSQWYFRNQDKVNAWLEKNPCSAMTPGRIKRLVNDWLKDQDLGEATMNELRAEYGFGKAKVTTPKSKGKTDDTKTEASKDGADQKQDDVIRRRPFSKMKTQELVDWLDSFSMEITHRMEVKAKALSFDKEQLMQIEKALNLIADAQVGIENKLKNAGMKTVETNKAA